MRTHNAGLNRLRKSARLSPLRTFRLRYTVTASELETILRRLQEAVPSSRVSAKRQLLVSARELILALHQGGHSWRSLARELSTATGESISADLLRTACMKRSPRRRSRRASSAPATEYPTQQPSAKPVMLETTNASFGAKGLKL